MRDPKITIDRGLMCGQPCIAGTRIPVRLILHRLADGALRHQLIQSYPNLTDDDILAALRFAADEINEKYGTLTDGRNAHDDGNNDRDDTDENPPLPGGLGGALPGAGR